ncbi:protein disulfide oxidoreductase [Methylomonas sp.]|uniref:protein disulfide oxidoreductase n=1 Tax=Methylomonas sp. TaxID=418 RepID=UPI0025EE43D0|nr:protein disulfide oxidoreductase [Methylomonas sp.]
MLKKSAFYIFAMIFVFAGQFLMTRGLVTGQPPLITQATLSNQNPMPTLAKGPAIIYFWAEWCGVCRGMQGNISAVLQDIPGITVAVRSGNNQQLSEYLYKNELAWTVVNDQDGEVGQQYGVQAVPALFFVNDQGHIVFNSAGYTSEWGLRLRLWLAGLL